MKHRWNQSDMGGFEIQAFELAACFYLFFSGPWGFFRNPAALLHIINITWSFWVFNLGDRSSSFIIKVLDGIFFQNKPVSSMLKTCSGKYPFSSTIALNVSGYVLDPSTSADGACPSNSVHLSWNLFWNLSNQPLLARNSVGSSGPVYYPGWGSSLLCLWAFASPANCW